MTSFQYLITTAEGKHLSGIISADSPERAKESLHKLGYVIISLEETTEPLGKTDRPTFAFEATDSNGKKVIGTVVANSALVATEKLEKEYNLTILKLEPQIGSVQPDTHATVSDEHLVIEEAKLVIEKAGRLLDKITPFDLDYNTLFDRRDELRTLLDQGNTELLRGKIREILDILQEREKTDIIFEKEQVLDQILVDSKQQRAAVKTEAEELAQHTFNHFFNLTLTEVQILSRWLILFYALFLVIAHVAVSKSLVFFGMDFFGKTIADPLLYRIALVVLLVQLVASFKLAFFKAAAWPGILMGILTVVIALWVFLIGPGMIVA